MGHQVRSLSPAPRAVGSDITISISLACLVFVLLTAFVSNPCSGTEAHCKGCRVLGVVPKDDGFAWQCRSKRAHAGSVVKAAGNDNNAASDHERSTILLYTLACVAPHMKP